MLIEPKCAICGQPSARIEILEPGEAPHDFEEWEDKWRELFLKYRDPATWRLLFSSIAGGNGVTGDSMTEEEANRWLVALREPMTYERVHSLGVYDDISFCNECETPYCATHWRVDTSGYGTCPRGHGKSLDPHWSPDWV